MMDVDATPADLPAHTKASPLGNSGDRANYQRSIGFRDGAGVYLYEHRNHASKRRSTVTIQGE